MANIAIVDDDLSMDLLVENLRYRGHEAFRIPTVGEALKKIKSLVRNDLIVLDIMMPPPYSGTISSQASTTHSAGMEIFREARRHNKRVPIVAYSATSDSDLIEVLSEDKATTFISKWETKSIKELVAHIYGVLGLEEIVPPPIPFIVHGQNVHAKLSIKNYLQNTLKLPEPIILHEQPNIGRTIIEKFEDYAAKSSVVFVLLTPDDVGAKIEDSDDLKRRARQNVIFEMGYFLGMLGRKSGRVILLYEGPLELPSDLTGVVYIDISKGIEAAGEQIRREIQNVQ